MTTSIPTPALGTHSRNKRSRLPALTLAVLTVTLVVSVAALLSPTLMSASTRDLPELRAGIAELYEQG